MTRDQAISEASLLALRDNRVRFVVWNSETDSHSIEIIPPGEPIRFVSVRLLIATCHPNMEISYA